MSLIPFEPFRQLDNMRWGLNQLFNSGFGLSQNFGMPRIDLYETETEVVATSDTPGLEKKDDVTNHIDDHNLCLSVEQSTG
ncbi:hypothetical protein [Bacillus sp. T33-2]|uniref:hypothetical protein n=1 Tax=Bacillus sp. T33-2 TaxID=2054168 RepID=UPI0026AE3C34